MKKSFRLLCLILSVVMMITAFSGCGKEEEVDLRDQIVTTTSTTVTGGTASDVNGKTGSQEITTTTVTEDAWEGVDIGGEKIDKDTVRNYDFGGKTIIIDGMAGPDASKSKAETAHAEVFEKIEAMNCKVKFVKRTFSETKQQTVLNVMSDTYFADIVMGPQHGVVGYLTSDLLYDMSKIKTMDLSQGYMNVATGVEAFRLGSGIWAVNYPYELAQLGNYVYYNKRIMKEVMGDENYPYKLMDKGEWNISNLRTISKKATKELDGDGKMTSADQWGLLFSDYGTAGFGAVLQANRALMIKNVNGMLSYNMEDGKCIPAINLGMELFVNDKACLSVANNNAFTSGHGLFMGGAFATTCSMIADMKDDFGILPFPLGEGQTEYSVPANWNTDTLAVPVCIGKDKLNNAGAFIQAYMLYSEEILIPALFDEYTLRYCRDDESKENLMIGYRAQCTPPSNAVANDGAIQMGTYKVCYETAKGKASPATLIAENKGISAKAINDLNAKLK